MERREAAWKVSPGMEQVNTAGFLAPADVPSSFSSSSSSASFFSPFLLSRIRFKYINFSSPKLTVGKVAVRVSHSRNLGNPSRLLPCPAVPVGFRKGDLGTSASLLFKGIRREKKERKLGRE